MGFSQRIRRSLLLLPALSLLATPGADAARWLVVSSANAPGQNDTQWRTDFTGINPGTQDASVRVTLLPPGTDNTALDIKADVPLPARGQKSIQNVLESLFSRSGSGALLLDSSASGLVLTTRTYNQQPDRQYGMLLPAIPEAEILQAGETGHIIFVADSTRYRTNVIYVNASSSAGKITTTLYDRNNNVIGTVARDVLPYGQGQFNAFSASGAPSTTGARAEVTGTVAFAAVATVIDANTGDPFAVFARRAATASADLLLPAAVHAAGDKNSKFRSDVRIFNPASDAATVTLSFYPRGDSSTSPETRTVPIPGKGLAVLDDILLETFQKESAAGAIRMSGTKPIMAISSTYNEAPEGTSGQDLPAIPVDQLINAGDTARLSSLIGGAFRTNLLLVNPSSTPLSLQLTMKSTGGQQLAQKTFELKAQSMDQINKLITDYFGLPSETSGFLEVTTVSTARQPEPQAEAAKYWVTATVIENTSNDPFQVTPSIERKPAPGGECVTMNLPRNGLKATYRLTSNNSSPETSTSTFVSVTETRAETQTTTTTVLGTINSLSVSEYNLVDSPGQGYLALKRVSVQNTVPFVGNVTTTVEFSPALLEGPGKYWCAGVKWTTPSVTQTVVTTPPGSTSTTQTAQTSGEVIAVNEQITVGAGTFATGHARRPLVVPGQGIGTSETWIAIEHGIPAKQISTQPNGTVDTIELIRLE